MKDTVGKLKKKQPVRYGIVSGVSTALDLGVYGALTFVGLPVLVANFLSTSAGFCVSFFFNRRYTFKSTDQRVR